MRRVIPFLLAAAAAALTGQPIAGATFTVGPSGCSHTTLAGALAAAQASGTTDTIRIGSSITEAGPFTLTNKAQQVTIRGSVSCADATPALRVVTLSSGNGFTLTNSTVEIRSLNIISGASGGRLLSAAGGAVYVYDTLLRDGKATNGANVYLSGGATFLAGSGARINDGVASFNGGGIYCTGNGVVVLDEGSWVRGNRAHFDGGGVYLTSGCFLGLLAGGPVPGGPFEWFTYGVFENRADFNGGGIYATAGATVNLIGGALPASVVNNRADWRGAGIYLTGNGTTALLTDAQVGQNLARRDGGGLYVTDKASLVMRRQSSACRRGALCSVLHNNGGQGHLDNTTRGGHLAVTKGGQAQIYQTTLTRGGSNVVHGGAAWISEAGSFALFEGVVVDRVNPGQQGTPFSVDSGALLRMAFTSTVGLLVNSNDGMFSIQDSSRVELFSSILGETAGKVLRTTDPGATPDTAQFRIDCTVVRESASFLGRVNTDSTDFLAQANPSLNYVHPAGGNVHLQPGSAAIDYCDTHYYTPVRGDIDGEARGWDDPSRPNYFGTHDLGADERRPLFNDGFNAGHTGNWSAVVP